MPFNTRGLILKNLNQEGFRENRAVVTWNLGTTLKFAWSQSGS